MRIRIAAVLLASSALVGASHERVAPSAFRGRLIDAVRGTPIGGAMVTVEDGDSARTTSDGSFTIAKVTPDVHVLWVTSAGYPDLRLPALLAPKGGDLKFAIALRALPATGDSTGTFRGPSPLFVVHARADSEQVGYGTVVSLRRNATGPDSIVWIDVYKGRVAADLFGAGAAGGAICITLQAAVAKPRSC